MITLVFLCSFPHHQYLASFLLWITKLYPQGYSHRFPQTILSFYIKQSFTIKSALFDAKNASFTWKLIATEIKSKPKESQQKVKQSINPSQPQLQIRLKVVN